jgi:hypothetical protein
MHRKLESEFLGQLLTPKRFSEWPLYRVKPAATYCNTKFVQVKPRCFSRQELLRVKNFDRCQRKLRYVASLTSRKETVGGLLQLRGEIEV